jgi:hypothetical protein
MSITRAVHGAVLMIGVVVGTVACGGGGGGASPNPGQPVLGKAFQDKAETICADVLAKKKAQGPFPFPDFNPTDPDVSKLPAIARIEKTTAQIYRDWLSELEALGQPPSGRAGWNEIVGAVRTNGRIIADQQKAGERSDAETFTKDFYDGTKAQQEIERASNAVGLPGCAAASAA